MYMVIMGVRSRGVEFPSPGNRHGNSQNFQEFPMHLREFPESGLELETGVTVAFSEISPTSEPTVYWPLTAQ